MMEPVLQVQTVLPALRASESASVSNSTQLNNPANRYKLAIWETTISCRGTFTCYLFYLEPVLINQPNTGQTPKHPTPMTTGHHQEPAEPSIMLLSRTSMNHECPDISDRVLACSGQAENGVDAPLFAVIDPNVLVVTSVAAGMCASFMLCSTGSRSV